MDSSEKQFILNKISLGFYELQVHNYLNINRLQFNMSLND